MSKCELRHAVGDDARDCRVGRRFFPTTSMARSGGSRASRFNVLASVAAREAHCRGPERMEMRDLDTPEHAWERAVSPMSPQCTLIHIYPRRNVYVSGIGATHTRQGE